MSRMIPLGKYDSSVISAYRKLFNDHNIELEIVDTSNVHSHYASGLQTTVQLLVAEDQLGQARSLVRKFEMDSMSRVQELDLQIRKRLLKVGLIVLIVILYCVIFIMGI